MTRHHATAIERRTYCVVCDKPLSLHQQFAGDICDNWRCRWTRLDREIEAHRQEAADVLGEKHPEIYRSLVVPHRRGSIENLPAGRRADHLEFLSKLVKKATLGKIRDAGYCSEPADSDIGPPNALAAAVCAVCKGACCHRAGDHAFLDIAAVERVIAASPQTEPSKIVRTYAAHLPERSFAGSCVYHTIDGCALPRSLRADICNAYRCSGLKQAERWARENGTTRIYVVARIDNIIKRSAFVQPGNIRHYPPTNALPVSKRSVDIIQMRQDLFR